MGRFKTQNGSKNGSQMHFSKSDPAPFGKLKQVVLAHFEPVVTRFGPWENARMPCKWAALGPKMGQKWV